jgi:hypothetical protein
MQQPSRVPHIFHYIEEGKNAKKHLDEKIINEFKKALRKRIK